MSAGSSTCWKKLPYDLAILPPGPYPKESKSWSGRDMSISVFMAALFRIAKK